MVFKKGLDNEFHRFNVCIIPRAPRSKRRRLPHKSAVEDTQICAFELLASLAGKLLQESESSSASSNASEGNDHPHIHKDVIKQEQQHEYKQLKAECNDQGSCEASVDISESTTEKSNGKCLPSQFPRVVDGYLKTTGSQSKKAYGNFPSKLEGVSSDSGESSGGFMENAFGQRQEAERLGNEGLTMAKICHSKDSTDLRMAYPALINPDRHVNLRSCRDHISNVSFAKHRNDLKLRSRDDDENFSRCYKFSNKFKAYRPPTRIGDRRIRKLLTSKYWKVAPKLKDFELSRSDGGMKPLYQKRKINYRHERYKYDALYKKRRLSDRSSVVTSDGVFSSESVSNSPQKGMNGEKSGTAAMFHGGGVPASITGHQVSHQSKDSHVKFSIKSFKVPELFIEVPESATLGSLKRTVMEAVTALLGGGIRVGVLVQGKKVRDDSRTLSQTGISCKEKLETLGFSLEPSPSQAPAPVCSDDPSLLLPCDATKLQLRSPATPALDSEPSDSLPDPPPLNNPDNYVENNHELSPPYSDSLDNKTLSDSRALVPVPAMSVKALAVVPVNQKMRRSELAQRRTRRPFSVSEVEALVQAVEELGTGRWRDVKLRAFENADHRTYVDLKDKWKTLVHTARIAPQQRRGEPVPQELLDRVLAAHAFWSQHQAKQQGKRQAGTGTLKITDGQPERSGDGAIQLM